MKTIRSWLRRPAGWMMVIMLMGAGAAYARVDQDRSSESAPAETEAMIDEARDGASA